MIDTAIFERVQAQIDQDSAVREEIRVITRKLDAEGRISQSILARAHSTPDKDVGPIVKQAIKSMTRQRHLIDDLGRIAGRHPYYKYNGLWTRQIQDFCYHQLFEAYLAGAPGRECEKGQLLSLAALSNHMHLPEPSEKEDGFHISIEEYLQAIISLIEELARLAVNSVTLGDFHRPLEISKFVKDLHAGFQLLNLKNDSLRRRSDGLKYSVKKIEEVVYDLSLRGLIPKDG